MAIELRAIGVSPGANSKDCIIVKPVGLAEGDLMVAQCVVNIISGTPDDFIYVEAGWVQIRTDATTTFRSSLWWKIADADDVAATNFTFSRDTSVCVLGAISAWTGHDPITPIDADNGDAKYFDDPEGEVSCSGITPSVADCMILLFCGVSAPDTCSNYRITNDDPAGWTEAYDILTTAGRDATCAMAYDIRAETTATGNAEIDATFGEDYASCQIVAIAPAGEPPPEPTKPYTPHCGPRHKKTQFMPSLRMGL